MAKKSTQARCFELAETVVLAHQAAIDVRVAVERNNKKDAIWALKQVDRNLRDARRLGASPGAVDKVLRDVARYEGALPKSQWRKGLKGAGASLERSTQEIFKGSARKCGSRS